MSDCEAYLPLISEHSLGLLEPAERALLDAHLASCTACVERSQSVGALGDLLSSVIEPVMPSPALMGRLMHHVRGEGRFSDLTPTVAQLFDLSETATRQLLSRISVDDGWMPYGDISGLEVMPVVGGSKVAGAVSAIARLLPGSVFPHHRHSGSERNLILQGGLKEHGGEEYWAGQLFSKEENSEHSYHAISGPPCIIAAVFWGELIFGVQP